MNYILEEKFFNSFRLINQLSAKLASEGAELSSIASQGQHLQLAGAYLAIGERETAASVLKKFIDNNITQENIFLSPLPVQFFSQLIFLYISLDRLSEARHYSELFNSYLSSDLTAFSHEKNTVARHCSRVIDIILSRDVELYKECLKELQLMFDAVSKNGGEFPVDFKICVLEYYALCHRLMNNANEAIELYKTAAETASEGGVYFREMQLYLSISRLYEEIGQYRVALEYYNKYCSVRDEILRAKDSAYSQYLIMLYGMSTQETGEEEQKDAKASVPREYIDDLTGLYKRNYWDVFVDDFFEDNTFSEALWSALFVNVDSFKQYNESCGHLKGDGALARLGVIISSMEDDNSASFRWSGDEFLILLPYFGEKEANDRAQEIISALDAAAIPFSGSEHGEKLTVSIGCYTQVCFSAEDVVALAEKAESAMKKAKNDGKNRFERLYDSF
jgi:diguanylate cyclase (GGDEF)-like protein